MTPKDKEKKVVTPAPTPEPQPTPAAPAVAAPVATTPSKQQTTLDNLKAAWTARKVDLSKLTTKMDGKFMHVVVGEGWPLIVIGVGGGIDLPSIRSYPRAFDAAVNGDTLLKKQVERAAKATAPAPAVAAKPEEKKAVTPAAKKQEQHAQLEKQIENRA